jgi:hypothetical protein
MRDLLIPPPQRILSTSNKSLEMFELPGLREVEAKVQAEGSELSTSRKE